MSTHRHILATLLAVMLSTAPSGVFAADPPEPGPPRDLVLDDRLQLAGHITLGGALAVSLAGVILIEADPFALAYGDIGFGLVGAGIGALVTASCLLGFSRPVHLPTDPPVGIRPRRVALFVPGTIGLGLVTEL